MDLSVLIGTIGALVVVFTSARSEIQNFGIFSNWIGPLLVFGCTMATGLVCLRFGPFLAMVRVFFRTLLGVGGNPALRVIEEIVTLATKQNDGQALTDQIAQVHNPFLRESLELMEKGSVSDGELAVILEKRLEVQNELYVRAASMFKTLGKFPPAFGLIGTSLGMIALLQGLGSPDSFKRIGPSMSTALLATFYGLILANIILIPFGENLARASQQDLVVRRIVLDGVALLKQQKHPVVVSEFLRSYLSPGERNKLAKHQAA